MSTYRILTAEGETENIIEADESFVQAVYPGRWERVDEPPAPQTPGDPTLHLIDVGPFFDRFGAAKLAVLASSDPMVNALVKDLQVRQWIDLTRDDVAQGIDLLISKNVQGVNAALKKSILETPVAHDENLALRKRYFS